MFNCLFIPPVRTFYRFLLGAPSLLHIYAARVVVVINDFIFLCLYIGGRIERFLCTST